MLKTLETNYQMEFELFLPTLLEMTWLNGHNFSSDEISWKIPFHCLKEDRCLSFWGMIFEINYEKKSDWKLKKNFFSRVSDEKHFLNIIYFIIIFTYIFDAWNSIQSKKSIKLGHKITRNSLL